MANYQITQNIAMIRSIRREHAAAHTARIEALKERNYTIQIERNFVQFAAAVSEYATANQPATKPVRTSRKQSEQKSPELARIERLCQLHGKNMFVRVQNPVRHTWMMLYSTINDLVETYGWSENSISQWLEFAKEF